MNFTDLLDEYLAAKEELQEAVNGYDGYSFGYHHDIEIRREHDAAKALNEAFSALTKQE